MAASKAKMKRVMKRAGKLRKEGKSASAAMKTAWKEENGGSTSKSKTKSGKSQEKPRKKIFGIF
ncbi:hypothetical protein GCM10011514_16710 [Emticicia aquatilis]|uniref:Uncharacterized protein n=1 Tax=Emticicia aquatilis TaxID=1537369 RepID=A0A916YNE8_9BACT|nr:hypothetical protein [Emticicia aquatilis]GGD53262.1 hypothetical protein GCM10011514_16710 [Emticicia aquatilis]